MITFKKIKFRNFLSTGNNFTEINFNESKTTLIIGSNGSGKSTLLDALCFVLFNKSFRKITKSQIINSTNGKDCLVEVDFEYNNISWKVRRGIKPNIFDILKDGKPLDQLSSINDQQEWLEKNVLRMSYKSFTQIVILGSASFVPFMQLNSSNRREVVEDLLDIKIFSSMNIVLKEKIKGINEKIKDHVSDIDLISEKILMQKKFIKSIESKGKEELEEKEKKIKEIKDDIKNLEKDNEEKNKKIKNQIEPKIIEFSESSSKLKKLNTIKLKFENKIENKKEQQLFFESSSVCPTCTQKIDEQFRLNKIKEYTNELSDLKNGFNELKSALVEAEEREKNFIELSKTISNLNNEISNNNFKISQFNKRTREIENEIQEITNRTKDTNSERSNLVKLEKKLNKVKNDRSKYKEIESYYTFIQSLLKDGGVKRKIIKKYLPLMNQQINKYLQMMDLYINFNLDEEFNEQIKTPIHEDFSYSSFSEGEKMRINLALLFTWREIAKMKNSVSTNILILDEVFDSSLDGSGIEYFTKIIRYVISDANIMVITHKTDEMIDLFEKVIRFEKIKGFSKKNET